MVVKLWRLTIQTDNPYVGVLVTREVAQAEITAWATWSLQRKQAAEEAAASFSQEPQSMDGILVRQIFGLCEDDDDETPQPQPTEGETPPPEKGTILRQTIIAYRFEDVIGMSACDTGLQVEITQ